MENCVSKKKDKRKSSMRHGLINLPVFYLIAVEAVLLFYVHELKGY